MRPEDFREYQAAVIEADQERSRWAYWLAMCEIGPEPSIRKHRKAWLDYVSELNRKATEILARPI